MFRMVGGTYVVVQLVCLESRRIISVSWHSSPIKRRALLASKWITLLPLLAFQIFLLTPSWIKVYRNMTTHLWAMFLGHCQLSIIAKRFSSVFGQSVYWVVGSGVIDDIPPTWSNPTWPVDLPACGRTVKVILPVWKIWYQDKECLWLSCSVIMQCVHGSSWFLSSTQVIPLPPSAAESLAQGLSVFPCCVVLNPPAHNHALSYLHFVVGRKEVFLPCLVRKEYICSSGKGNSICVLCKPVSHTWFWQSDSWRLADWKWAGV